ncbi:MAG: homoserine O-succinyltransferase [Firmicutes bacterium]|nr:homoserine O-succinyltransferase [Bacillota bacterium]
MPIIIPEDIPAFKILADENVFVMPYERAVAQDIRPIEIAILNLMPTKIETETQLIRLLANTPLQVNLTLIQTATYKPQNVAEEHMERFYTTFSQIKNKKFDGMIVTGAPVETMEFEDVRYWDELKEVLDFAREKVTSTVFICWGAQAAMYRYYGIGKSAFKKKLFGVFENTAHTPYEPLLKGLNDSFFIPHSRYTAVDEKAVLAHKDIEVLATGKECGISIAKSKDNSAFFFFGHSEYDRETLGGEYFRDKKKGMKTAPPKNYFADKKEKSINMTWNSTGNLLFYNWLNHYVYQVTPFAL